MCDNVKNQNVEKILLCCMTTVNCMMIQYALRTSGDINRDITFKARKFSKCLLVLLTEDKVKIRKFRLVYIFKSR